MQYGGTSGRIPFNRSEYTALFNLWLGPVWKKRLWIATIASATMDVVTWLGDRRVAVNQAAPW